MLGKRRFSEYTTNCFGDPVSSWGLKSPDRDLKTKFSFSTVIEEEFEDLKDAKHALFACMFDNSERLKSCLLDSIQHDKRWDHFRLQLLNITVELGHSNTQMYLDKCLKSEDSIDLKPPGDILILERAIVMQN